MTRFRDLPVGATFDFVDDICPEHNSFYSRCRKESARGYSWEYSPEVGAAPKRLSTNVGTINVEVFHVSDQSNSTTEE